MKNPFKKSRPAISNTSKALVGASLLIFAAKALKKR